MRPVFVGGCERSGTTLLGAMLGGHPRHLCVPEMQFKLDIVRSAGNGHQGMVDLSDGIQQLTKRSSFRTWELDLKEASTSSKRLSSREFIEWCVKAYGQKVERSAPVVWIDHTPKNVKYASTLLQLFPDAKMIHIVRDGRAVAASVMPLDWGPNEIEHAARFWAERLAYGLAAESRQREQVIRVRYEDLVRDPQATLQRLCATLAIDYTPTMSQAVGFNAPRYTVRQHALIGKPPDPARVNAWEQQLSSRQIEIFESIAADLLESLGYTPKFGVHARKISRGESLLGNLRELYKKELVNRLRKRRRRRATVPA